jgi:cobalamin biosynthetic protein CobC
MHGTVHAPVGDFARHGGRIDLARAAFPHVARWTDLSTGIAPWSYPTACYVDMVERLPDPAEVKALEAAAATYFGTLAERVVAVPGSDLAMRLIGMLLAGRGSCFRAAVVAPGYSGHGAIWGGSGVTACAIHDIAGIAQDHDALVLARPNNPDGRVAAASMLEEAAHALAARGGHLIVDEAFADALPGDSLAGACWPGLIVLRSFGKFFGLAGLRLGFVIAPPAIGQAVRALIGDWPVSGPALATGLAAYGEVAWHAAQRARLVQASQRLIDTLTRHGLAIVGSTPFFALVSAERRNSLFVHLAESGVLTRPFAHSLDWLRFGLPRDDEDWRRLEAALGTWRTR